MYQIFENNDTVPNKFSFHSLNLHMQFYMHVHIRTNVFTPTSVSQNRITWNHMRNFSNPVTLPKKQSDVAKIPLIQGQLLWTTYNKEKITDKT